MITIGGKDKHQVPDLILEWVREGEKRRNYATGTAATMKAAAEAPENNWDKYADWLEAAKAISATIILSSPPFVAPMHMDIDPETGPGSSSNPGTERDDSALIFGSTLFNNKNSLQNVIFVMNNLGAEASAFCQFIQNDPLTTIEFELGNPRDAGGETFLYAYLDKWVNLDDPAALIFIDWYKINRNTKLKIRMILRDSAKPEVIYSRAVHELTVHGIFYRQFIEFIRSASNESSEVALYFYRHIHYDKELNGYTQHYLHGCSPHSEQSGLRERGAPRSLDPASGIPAYNETILKLIEVVWDTDTKKAQSIKKEAEFDVNRHKSQYQTEAPTEKKSSYQKRDIKLVNAISPRQRSLSQLFAYFSGKKQSDMDNLALVLESLTPDWVKLLLSYYDYKATIGEVFPFNRSVLENLSAIGDGKAISVWIQEPLAETVPEAIAEFLVYGWQCFDTPMSDQWDFVRNLLFEANLEDWSVIKTYIAFRCLYYIATGNMDKAKIWHSTGEDIPNRVLVLKDIV